MKSFFKCFLTLGMVVTLFIGMNVESLACNKTSGCYASVEATRCGSVYGNNIGTHIVTEPNGYRTTCGVTQVSGPHTISCQGCGAFLRQENRVCSIVHSNVHCFSQYNLCK